MLELPGPSLWRETGGSLPGPSHLPPTRDAETLPLLALRDKGRMTFEPQLLNPRKPQ